MNNHTSETINICLRHAMYHMLCTTWCYKCQTIQQCHNLENILINNFLHHPLKSIKSFLKFCKHHFFKPNFNSKLCFLSKSDLFFLFLNFFLLKFSLTLLTLIQKAISMKIWNMKEDGNLSKISFVTSILIYHAAFEICLCTRQFVKVLPREIWIFCNVHWQNIVEDKLY